MRSPTSRLLTLQIDSLNSEGMGVARRGRDVFFVAGALPGEVVEATLGERRRKVCYAKVKRVIEPSPHRVEPACAHFQRCGGCQLQHLDYPQQVDAKQQRVQREFSRAGVDVEFWQPPLVAAPWHYRRKARLGVRFSKEKQEVYLGFRESASSHISSIDFCPVMVEHPLLNWQQWREFLQQWPRRAELTQIEALQADNALVLTLRLLKPLAPDSEQQLIAFVNNQAEALPVQLWLKYHKHAPPEPLRTDYPELVHQVDGHDLQLQPDDFVQVNRAVNLAMVEQAMDWLAPEPDEQIADLFAGHGNFSMALARRRANVVAVEVQANMVSSLQEQARRQGLAVTAQQADLSSAQALQALPALDAVLLDPPRAGAAAVVEHLIDNPVGRILYVACDAATLSRDLGSLVAGGYRVTRAGIMDMFPQTHHVETMVLLTRVGK
ncbi:23S rRNA (uracil(1939)-C(5))-methyltransferase [Bacterioplanes sanyensis]|uniref:23S rRNA (Uracil(1939)-C(5))-methyltransferase n=1 Tax=Bacterioplanes sanyensis TaxID=1249553 RepID=A0A222FJI2_9GAMM|nr:methyltransferase domain-containing protein [Bacterioplanes sanyensis]ASP39207.1 23S rRNA (uracil(1939)-C(5))-methyltransferase [Bacterioplanes sanyensis]